jgi:hypothetical protein
MLDMDNIVDTQSEAEELEEVVMGLIINSGQARSLAYGALKGQAGRFRVGENDDGPVSSGAERSAPRADETD